VTLSFTKSKAITINCRCR